MNVSRFASGSNNMRMFPTIVGLIAAMYLAAASAAEAEEPSPSTAALSTAVLRNFGPVPVKTVAQPRFYSPYYRPYSYYYRPYSWYYRSPSYYARWALSPYYPYPRYFAGYRPWYYGSYFGWRYPAGGSLYYGPGFYVYGGPVGPPALSGCYYW